MNPYGIFEALNTLKKLSFQNKFDIMKGVWLKLPIRKKRQKWCRLKQINMDDRQLLDVVVTFQENFQRVSFSNIRR